MPIIAWLIFIAAAILEVMGNVMIRKGSYERGLVSVISGFVILGCYGLVVNLLQWDFSRLLGVYVSVFALLSVLCGRFVFSEDVPASTWIGLLIIVAGGLVIQFGEEFKW
jgi:small multidrug resistance family-3 protein